MSSPQNKGPTMLPGEVREQIARVIDPSTWQVLDSYLAEMLRKYRGVDAGYDPEAFKDKASLAKADAIIALISNTTSAGGDETARRIAELEGWWYAVPEEQRFEIMADAAWKRHVAAAPAAPIGSGHGE